MDYLLSLLASPDAWAALITLTAMEVVLGIDNLIFISILTNKLPPEHRDKARKIGIGLALLMRIGLVSIIAFIVGLTAPVVSLFELDFSWRDLILLAGGLFLLWKATREIHHHVDPDAGGELKMAAASTFALAIVQILLLDAVFSVDSILTAVGMTEHLPIMIVAIFISIGVMLFAAKPLGDFVNANPTVVMLALAFLLMIGMMLMAEGFGVHVPKGYIYAAMAFSCMVEALNILSRRAARKKRAEGGSAP
ncbi:MAG: TerC family protein [Rhodovibrionaceae bacterium]